MICYVCFFQLIGENSLLNILLQFSSGLVQFCFFQMRRVIKNRSQELCHGHKKDLLAPPTQIFIWYDRFLSLIYTCFHTKRRLSLAGGNQAFFWYENSKDPKSCYYMTWLKYLACLGQGSIIFLVVLYMSVWVSFQNNISNEWVAQTELKRNMNNLHFCGSMIYLLLMGFIFGCFAK